MISVRLRNPALILTPITDEEKEAAEKEFMGDESIYVLYKLPTSGNIHIGMMSSSVRRYSPGVANIWNLDEATSMAFFHNGGSKLEAGARSITDRPVYRIVPGDDRVVNECQILNGTPYNGLEVELDDVVEGNYSINKEEPVEYKKAK